MEKPKILVIDDESDMLFVLSQVLIANGYDICTADNAKDGINLFYSFVPDLVLLDRIMPGMSGDEVLKEIRQKGSRTPVILLTAKNSPEDLLEGFESGANDYIRKPFSMKELLARINSFLTLSDKYAADKILTIGKFSLDTLSQELYLGDELFPLTNMEYSILKILVENKNHEVLTNSIIKSLWSDDNGHSNANVQVYVCKLRKILHKDPAVKLISMRSIGYKLIET